MQSSMTISAGNSGHSGNTRRESLALDCTPGQRRSSMMVTRSLSNAAAAAALGLAAGLASAQPYPSKPVRLIAPFPPGGTSDVLSRLLAQRLSDSLTRQVVVENRPGAGSNLG